MTDTQTDEKQKKENGTGGGGNQTDGAKVRDWGLKTAGAIIGGLGTAGAMVVIGSAVLWVRFEETGVPPVQAVSVQARQEALVQGAQATILSLLIAVGAVALMYVTDRIGKSKEEIERPPHKIGGLTTIVLGLLVVVAILYITVWTDLSAGSVLILSAIALLLAWIAFWFGRREDKDFWALAAVVFVAAIVFGGATGYAVVKEQKYVQAVAILRDEDDAGLTGYYVAVTDKKIYFANSIGAEQKPAPGEAVPTGPESKPMQEVSITDSVTYAVGPLESAGNATVRAQAMLKRLIANREANPTKGAEGAEETNDDGTEDQGGGTTAGVAPDTLQQASKAFLRLVVINRRVTTRNPLCIVRYTDATVAARGRWWTTCASARRLGPVENVREKLALPNRGRALDMRVWGEIPVGTRVLTLRGRAAPRCEHVPGKACGHEYSGGGALYFVSRPQLVEILDRKCTSAREDQAPDWASCKKVPAN